MPGLPEGIRRAFRLPAGRRRIESEVGDEVAFHIEMTVRDLVGRGMDPDHAMAEAHRRFGDITRWSEAMSEVDRQRVGRARRTEWLDAIRHDVTYALRGMRRQPGFTVGVVLTLALGIGANATMFGIVDRLMLRPPPHVLKPETVQRVYFRETGETGEPFTSPSSNWALLATLRQQSRTFAGFSAIDRSQLVHGEGVAARPIPAAGVSADFFPMLGARPHLGRFFSAEEDAYPAGVPVVVVGYDFWKGELGGDPGALGRKVRLRDVDHEVVGVAPEGFTGVGLERIDAWVPFATLAHSGISRFLRDGETWDRTRNLIWFEIVGRRRDGVDLRTAEAELSTIYRQWYASPPKDPPSAQEIERSNPRVALGPMQVERGPNATDAGKVAGWLLGVSLLVLLIACANVANLLLARALRRRREIAVRMALGIGRARLVSQLVVESLALALLGGAAGILVAEWGGGLVRRVLIPDVAWTRAVADERMLLFTAAAAILTGLLAGLAPAVQASRPDIAGTLKSGGRGSGGAARPRAQRALLVVQATLSVVLLVGAGLFLRSLRNVTTLDMGYDPARVLMMSPDLTGAGYSRTESPAVQQQIYERVRALPGVESAALAMASPFYSTMTEDIRVPGLDSLPKIPSGAPTINAVTPDYFATMGTRIVRGRGFEEADGLGAAPVIVVNETMARLVWPGQEALGKCVRVGDADSIPCSTVVGVAQEVRWDDIRPEPEMQFYVPLAQRPARGFMRSILVRPRGDAAPVMAAMQRVALETAPRVTFVRVRSLAEFVEPSLRPWRLGASMFTAFGGLALVLAAVGLYGVLAYAVAQRTNEMGVRIALGASGGAVVRLVVGEGMRVVAIGTAIGLAAAWFLGRFVEALLYGVTAHDGLVILGVAATLLVTAAVASVIPALRATRVDPNVALRAE